MEGDLAREWERSILGRIKALGIRLGAPEGSPTFSGHTEAWAIDDLQVATVAELMDLVHAAEVTSEIREPKR
jgi:hypothetical protein